MTKETKNKLLKVLLVIFALCLHLAVFYSAARFVWNLINTKCTVIYQETCQATVHGATEQEVNFFGSPTVVIASPNAGFEFVEWSDGVKTKVRNDLFVTKSFTVYPICRMVMLDAPVVCINAEVETSEITKEEYVNCSISILNTDESYSITEASAKIRGRGNGTWWHAKKSYRIKFNKKTSVLGSDYKAKSWALIAVQSDKTLSRNALAFAVSERMESVEYTSSCKYVEVFLNDEYLGVYNLCDVIETGEGRVDISGEDDETSPGFLVEIEGRAAETGTENIDYFTFDETYYEIKTPDLSDYADSDDGDDSYNIKFVSYIKTFFAECYAALDGGDYGAVTKIIDVESFAETYIIHEVFAVIDCGYASVYLYKKSGDGKLTSGPVWDFDSAGGNFNYNYATEEECSPEMPLIAEILNVWYNKLLKFDEFRELVREKLAYYKEPFFETLELVNTDNPESFYALYEKELRRNFEKWQILEGVNIYDEPASVYTITTLEGQFDYLYDWLTARYYFVCEQYGAES